MPSAIPGHHGVYVMLGCLLAWIGWIGLNSAGALIFGAAPAGSVVRIAIDTTLGAGSAALRSP